MRATYSVCLVLGFMFLITFGKEPITKFSASFLLGPDTHLNTLF